MRLLLSLSLFTVVACGGGDGDEIIIPDMAQAPGSDLGAVDLAGVDLAGVAPDLAMGPVAGEPTGLTGITSEHNKVRQGAMPTPSPSLPPLVWSSTVAQAAQTWADGCQFKHSSNSYGENIYAASGQTVTAAAVVQNWASEAANYNYAANSCTGVCGHYTQIVWRDSARLGCGIKTCTTGSPFSNGQPWTFVVCDYDPPGNYNNQRPY